MNTILPSWSDFDTVLCEIEGRNPDTGRVLDVPQYRSLNQDSVDFRAREASRLAMRRLYDKRRAQGLTAQGKTPKKVSNSPLNALG